MSKPCYHRELIVQKIHEGILLKCLSESEAYLVVSNVHSRPCGPHHVGHKMKCLLFRQGFYCPIILKNYIEFAKGCQECQITVGIQHVPTSELHAIVKSWLFKGWDFDLVGEIRPTSSKIETYVLVSIDYFIKWIEEIPLVIVDQKALIDFFRRHIIYRFKISETITTDQGSAFNGRKMEEFAYDMRIKLFTSTPYYAQAVQVEETNKIIIGLIKTHVGKNPKDWHKTLDQVLWACRRSPKEATYTTPFRLTYGHDDVLPVEIYQ